MGKCRKCGKELTGIETTGWFGKLCEKCWQEQHYTQYPFKKGIDEKDKKIADLEAKLLKFAHRISDQNEEVLELKQQLAEKDELLKQKICDMKSTDFIRMCVDCGFMVQAKEIDNQTAIAVLEEMLDNEVYINSKLDFEDGNYVLSKIIRTKIEELRNGRN